jgi:hypothetical protein
VKQPRLFRWVDQTQLLLEKCGWLADKAAQKQKKQ